MCVIVFTLLLWQCTKRQSVGILGAYTMRPICGFKVHSLPLLFFHAFCLYPLSFHSLQYIYKGLYRSYLSVCPLCNSYCQRQPEFIFLLSYSDHGKDLHLLIGFQHKQIPVLSGWVSLIYTPIASLSGFILLPPS